MGISAVAANEAVIRGMTESLEQASSALGHNDWTPVISNFLSLKGTAERYFVEVPANGGFTHQLDELRKLGPEADKVVEGATKLRHVNEAAILPAEWGSGGFYEGLTYPADAQQAVKEGPKLVERYQQQLDELTKQLRSE